MLMKRMWTANVTTSKTWNTGRKTASRFPSGAARKVIGNELERVYLKLLK
jgi:hypothetical protein